MSDCLRDRKWTELLAVDLPVAPVYLSSMGPIVDSVVVPFDPRLLLLSQSFEQLDQTPADLLLGTYESASTIIGGCAGENAAFTDAELQLGITPMRRDHMIRTLVTNLYDRAHQAIFLALLNEYFDWRSETKLMSELNKQVTTPTTLSKSTLMSVSSILHDALILAPLIQTARLQHVNNRLQRNRATKSFATKRTYFYGINLDVSYYVF